MTRFGVAKTFCIVLMFCAASAIPLPAQTFTGLVSFDYTDGASPYSSVIQGVDGNFYGTTYGGGSGSNCFYNCGTVFEITPSGTLTTLHNFVGTDGSNPVGALVQGADGNFYGTTENGGANDLAECNQSPLVGCGTVFRITPSGVLTTLHSFCSLANCADGAWPTGTLVQGTDGNFYGTTWQGANQGSANTCLMDGRFGCGTVFKITPDGTLTVLHDFCSGSNCTDGYWPIGGLVQATDGNFYGTTAAGGGSGKGTIFKITAAGNLTTLGHPGSGNYATASLVQGVDGNFYGTTLSGGDGYGTVYRATPAGIVTTLHSFGFASDGEYPVGLVQATDGNFYGTTKTGTTGSYGEIYKITSTGTLTVVYNLAGNDGSTPVAALVQGTDGNFYGTTSSGGFNRYYGTVFQLDTGLAPFIETEPTSGAVGTPVTILGTNVAGATSVTFNGTAATFDIVSSTEITTTVPAGATTGPVKVTTPGGSVTSNVNFVVLEGLTVSTNGSGTVTSTDGFISCPGTCSNGYPANTPVTLNATAAAGWAFSNWTGACSGAGSCNLTMTRNLSVGATFTQLSYVLTVSTVGNGTVTSSDGHINCPGTCSYSYLSFSPVTLNASAASDWIFAGWTGACSGVGACNLTMTANLWRDCRLHRARPWTDLQRRHALPPRRYAKDRQSHSRAAPRRTTPCRNSAAATFPPPRRRTR